MKTTAIILCLLLAACDPEVAPPERSVARPQPAVLDENTGAESLPAALVDESLSKEKIKIALLLPLTGPEAPVGRALLRAATMALFDAYDPRLVLLPLDTKADVTQTEIVTRAALDEGVSIILGPLLAANVTAAGDVLEGTGVQLIGFSNDSSVAASGRFIMGFMPETEVKRVIDFAVEQGLIQHAALLPDGRYGMRVREAFADAVSSAGAVIAAIENYPPDPAAVFEPVKRLSNYDSRRKEMRDEIRFLRSLRDDLTDEIANKLATAEVLEGVNYDAVLLPEGGELLKTLAPLLPFYEIDPNKIKLLGTGLWNDPSLLREPPLQGAYFAAPHPAAPNAFLDRFEKAYGEKAPRIATLAYDAMSLVAYLSRMEPLLDENGEPLSNFTVERLITQEGFSGKDGLFRFLPDGTSERLLAVLEIHRRGFKVVDPALEAFPAFGYALRQLVSQE